MKTKVPNMGRPKRKPNDERLAQFNPNVMLLNDVAKILAKFGVPNHWTYMDVSLLIDWLFWPNAFDAVKTELVNPWEIRYTVPAVSFVDKSKVTMDHQKIAKALHLAKLFAEAPDALMDALPKIRNRVGKFLESPMGSVIFQQAIGSTWPWSPQSNPVIQEFWSKPANELAGNKLTGKNTTPRSIENARDKIRKTLNPKNILGSYISPKSKKTNG